MSSGQFPRRPDYFPRMKNRSAHRRLRRTLDNARRFAQAMNGQRYSRGGYIPRTQLIPTTIAVDECVLMPGRGWRCARTDPAHLNARHPNGPLT